MSAGQLFFVTLLSETAQTASKNGTSYAVVSEDPAQPLEQDFEVVFSLDYTPTGVTSPTFDARIEVSYDQGANWIPDAAMTQRTSAGTTNQRVTAKPGAWVRAVVTVGGTGGSHAWAGKVHLTSTGTLKIVAVSS